MGTRSGSDMEETRQNPAAFRPLFAVFAWPFVSVILLAMHAMKCRRFDSRVDATPTSGHREHKCATESSDDPSGDCLMAIRQLFPSFFWYLLSCAVQFKRSTKIDDDDQFFRCLFAFDRNFVADEQRDHKFYLDIDANRIGLSKALFRRRCTCGLRPSVFSARS